MGALSPAQWPDPAAGQWPDPAAGPGGLVDDATLIERSWTQPDFFGGIFDRHATEIHRYAARRLGFVHAEDVVGDTFLAAFRGRDRYDLTRRDARPWLFGIATNMISEQRRQEIKYLRALARTGIDPVTESATDDVVTRVTASSECRKIAAMIARLKVTERDTLLLVDWAGLSYEDAAKALGVPVGTVRSRLSRVRKRIRDALGGVSPMAEADSIAQEEM